MKRIFTFTIILMAMTACTGLQLETAEPTATIIPQVNMPNPASVYCEQNGNKLEKKRLPMTANPEYVFFRMAPLATNGLITGESAVLLSLRQPQKPTAVAMTQ